MSLRKLNQPKQGGALQSILFNIVIQLLKRAVAIGCLQGSIEEEFIAQPQKILYSALGLGLISTVVLSSEKKVQQSKLRLHNRKKDNNDRVCVTKRHTGVKIHYNLSLDTQIEVN